MRHIDTSSINVPADWLLLSKNKFGNTYPNLWSYFRESFEDIVGKKCWYSESKNLGSVNPIDHFRPKAAKIKKLTNVNADLDNSFWQQMDCNSRLGYTFLEFEFSNYRYSCTISNSLGHATSSSPKAKGKSNFFPLKIGSPYANSLASLHTEIVCLLDPCKQADVEKLSFNDLGEIEPHKSLKIDSWEYCQVKVSIELYHLHYYRFTETRKENWDFCKNRIRLIDKYSKKSIEEECVINYIDDLKKSIKKDSEFSAVAVDCIRLHKKQYSWLEDLFPEAQLLK